MLLYFILGGGIILGISVRWWKRQHRTRQEIILDELTAGLKKSEMLNKEIDQLYHTWCLRRDELVKVKDHCVELARHYNESC